MQKGERNGMANHYIFVGSITNAMHGRRVLESYGIQSFLQRSVRVSETDGCGYQLLITTDPQRAVQILRGRGVRVIRVADAL